MKIISLILVVLILFSGCTSVARVNAPREVEQGVYSERRRGIFKCPPLEAGAKYNLRFKGNYKNGGSLLLTDSKADSITVYEQVIPPLPK
ncbi:hypothetical protein [Treponema sp. R80B11-R83G3]